MSIDAPDFRYDAFLQTITPFAIGYTPNPKEVHIIPASAPYEIHLNEIPRGDSPSTLLINIQAGADFEEVSFSTIPSAGQFRAVYGTDIVPPVSIVGQGTVQFSSTDAGKTVECAYYGLGAIVQNQLFNQILAGQFGVPDVIARAVNYTGSVQNYIHTEELGDWNMYVTGGGTGTSTLLVPIPVTVSIPGLRGVFVQIKPDSFLSSSPLEEAGLIQDAGGAGLLLSCTVGGKYDAFPWSTTSYNRGWATYIYEK